MSDKKETLVVYKRFSTPQEAHIVNGLLSSANIYAEVINDDLSYAGFGTGMTGISQARLLVIEKDLKKIEAVLNAKFNNSDLTDEFK